MAHEQLGLTADQLLSTTRAVRKRLDFDRPVSKEVLKECLEMAVQAPTGSNAQGWQFVFVTDPDKKAKIADYYQKAFGPYRESDIAIHKLHMDSPDKTLKASQTRSASSADYLAENLGRAPVLMIPCIAGRSDTPELNSAPGQAGVFGSILPAVWSFMLAARARGLGTAWTMAHLFYERDVAEIIGIPYDQYMQVALTPIAYTKGTDFKPAYRPPVENIMHFDTW